MSFFSELKKRKVYRTAVAYAVVAFVIMQIIEIVFPMFGIPDWAGRMIIILLFLGFPITIVFSWMYDVGEKSMVRAKPMMVGGEEDMRNLFARKRIWFLSAGLVAAVLLGYHSSGTVFGYKIGKSEINNKSIAVLPFDNYSTAPEDQYFSDGVTEVITANLAKIKGLKVISRTSVMEYKNTTKKIREIAEELGVAHILEGSIQRIGDNIRIVGQLINTETDEHIWAETYDGKIDDIFMMQTDVALKIGEALKAQISDEATALISKKPTDNIQAYELYLKALELIGFSDQKDPIKKSIDHLKLAVNLDDQFAEAYALLGDGHLISYWFNYDRTPERLNKAKDAIDHAKRLKPNHPSVLKANGSYYYYGFRNYAKALVQYEKARAIAPGDSDVLARIGWINRRIGEWDEAIAYLEKGIQLNPRNVNSYHDLGETFQQVGDYETAVKFYQMAIEIEPTMIGSYVYLSEILFYDLDDEKSAVETLVRDLAWTESDDKKNSLFNFYLVRNEYDKALNVAKSFNKNIIPFITYVNTKPSMLGLINKLEGNKKEAEKQFIESVSLLEKELKHDPNDYTILISLGLDYAHLGKSDEAIKYGKRSVEILPESKDAFFGPQVLSNMGLIYTILDMEDEAIDIFDHLTSVPGGFSIGYLKKHSHFSKLRNNPRFKKILKNNKPVI